MPVSAGSCGRGEGGPSEWTCVPIHRGGGGSREVNARREAGETAYPQSPGPLGDLGPLGSRHSVLGSFPREAPGCGSARAPGSRSASRLRRAALAWSLAHSLR